MITARPKRRPLRREPLLIRWRREISRNWPDYLATALLEVGGALVPLLLIMR